ncbi:cobyrinate a,c-diamide synthase [Novosphingobium sp. G106]|uniref:cobyrinate a,c-diamide synthase n=1 Tax=Novosphingobium sp. G106 TaxID=2849500 RepID=UPI001C2D2D0F|nr:cobyrinate a,c-diamide synthase [Novosphingobium sp. G106]MBV1692291.1 cobyrinate a,c-diamide synthase [Novosphingobium sp. G106]
MATPGLLISAPASGTGKTTVSLGLLRALAEAGVAVQPFKSGPDYIDPAFHHAACGRASFNLDSWAMPEALLDTIVAQGENADMLLAEGAMGLFDGAAQRGASGQGASADLARLMGWPVVLVIDASGQAQSAAAVAHGFRAFDAELPFAGVILNRVASPRHERLVRSGMEVAGIRVFGALPRRPDLALSERHLGLVQAIEHAGLDALLSDYAALVREHVDLPALRQAARGIRRPTASLAAMKPPAQRIALAQDAAFSFSYPHLLAAWRQGGAEVRPFSPLADEAPAPDADLVWLPGGYPELHAGRLAAAERFHAGLAAHAAQRPVYGECGGYMVLGQGLIDRGGTRHRMAGLLGLVTSHADRRLHLGYRQARLLAPAAGFARDRQLRGHEFHYSTIVAQPDAPLAEVTDAEGAILAKTGSHRGHVAGTFFHLIAPDPS